MLTLGTMERSISARPLVSPWGSTPGGLPVAYQSIAIHHKREREPATMLKLTIKTDNAAFGETRRETLQELARILRDLADEIASGIAVYK